MQKHTAFTLTEMLIVSAVIAIIAAILFPVLTASRERAGQAACISNLGQLGKAFLMYAGDNDSVLPPYSNQGGSSPHVITTTSGNYLLSAARGDLLVRSLRPYIHSDAVWFCPEDPSAHTHTASVQIDHFYTSYVVSGFLGIVGHPATTEGTQIIQPDFPTTRLSLLWEDVDQKGLGPCPPLYSHDGSVNGLFFDGHVGSGRACAQ